MQVVIAGGTGFLGSALCRDLLGSGHTVAILTRRQPALSANGEPAGAKFVSWQPPYVGEEVQAAINSADAVVNLAGTSLANGRWTSARKERMRSSRIDATNALVTALDARPEQSHATVLINGSAVGYYGDRGDELLDEGSAAGADFLSQLCVQWENAALLATSPRTRVVLLRTGLVLGPGGALPRLALPFRLFAGGPLGSGKQWVSWIHLLDEIRLIRFAIEQAAVTGAVNATSPEPARERDLARAVGQAMGRPSWIPAPPFALRLLLGEMADATLLVSQRALPTAAVDAGFAFQYPRLDQALNSLLNA